MDMMRLQLVLQEITGILTKHKVSAWAEILQEQQRTLVESYSSGNDQAKQVALEDLEKIYGGMGSFSDVFINHLNDDIAPKEESTVNSRLSTLRSELYQLIQREKARL